MRTIPKACHYRGYDIYESKQNIPFRWTFRHKDATDELSDAYGETIVECKLQIDIIRFNRPEAARSEAEDTHPVTGSSNLETAVKQFITDHEITGPGTWIGGNDATNLVERLIFMVGYHKGEKK